MTDEQIIKALECCSGINREMCRNCIFSGIGTAQCVTNLTTGALNIINRLKAENEELREGFTADADYFASEYDSKIKSEARKEFVERLKNKFKHCRRDNAYISIINLLHYIDTVLNKYERKEDEGE